MCRNFRIRVRFLTFRMSGIYLSLDVKEFIATFEAYTYRHNLINDLDKSTALKMSGYPPMGDARIVLSGIIDRQINEDNIIYNVSSQLSACVTTHSLIFVRATKHFLELCSPQKSEKNDFVCLRNIEIVAKQVIQGYKKLVSKIKKYGGYDYGTFTIVRV